MIGNVVTGGQLVELVKSKVISISGFKEDRIQEVHYPLHVESLHSICGRRDDGNPELDQVYHKMGKSGEFYRFSSMKHLIVQISELVVFPRGIVAQFVPPHKIIREGFSLQAGRARAPFGEEGERLMFGVSNMLPVDNDFDCSAPVAYMYFFDVRGMKGVGGVDRSGYAQTKLFFESFMARKVADDGPNYE